MQARLGGLAPALLRAPPLFRAVLGWFGEPLANMKPGFLLAAGDTLLQHSLSLAPFSFFQPLFGVELQPGVNRTPERPRANMGMASSYAGVMM